jgi:hypothetical protein
MFSLSCRCCRWRLLQLPARTSLLLLYLFLYLVLNFFLDRFLSLSCCFLFVEVESETSTRPTRGENARI